MRPPNRILCVTKFRYIGDTVLTIPALRALRTRYPEAHLTLLTGVSAAETLQNCPYLDQIETYDRYSGQRGWRGQWQLIQSLRRQRYDTAVLFNRSNHSALIAFLARIPQRIGFNTEFRGPLLTRRVPWNQDQHELDCLLDVAQAVGAPPTGRQLELWPSPQERRDACEKFDMGSAMVNVIIQPGANDPHVRQWPTAHFVEAATRLHRETNCRLLLVGAENERESVGALAQRLTVPYLNLAGKTSIREMLAIMSHSDLFISADTGLMHCAVAVGIPTVGIYGPTKAKRWGHESPINRVLYTPASRPDPDEKEIRACIDAVSAHKVFEAASELLRQRVSSLQ